MKNSIVTSKGSANTNKWIQLRCFRYTIRFLQSISNTMGLYTGIIIHMGMVGGGLIKGWSE